MAYYYSPFRKRYGKKSDKCPFCDSANMKIESVRYGDGHAVENKHYRWIVNMYPKFEGHTLVVPKKHITKLGEENADQTLAREELISLASRTLMSLYPGSGIEVFIQTGEGSESSVGHLHWHVVPALPGDPLRGFDKMGHFFTIEPDKEKILIFPVKIKKAKKHLLKSLTKILKRK